jgi:hemerythrin superfamily protein
MHLLAAMHRHLGNGYVERARLRTPSDRKQASMGNVVDLIMNDHRELERLFDQLQNQPETRANTLPVMISLLTAHSRAEEAEVYPAATEAGIDEDVEHSQKEHLEADQLAAALAATPVDAPDFEEKLTKLVDAVKHHVEEEETTVLPGMRNGLPTDRLDSLGEAFLTSRETHLGEMPADITKAELEQQAANANLSGTSGQSKDELAESLKAAAEE